MKKSVFAKVSYVMTISMFVLIVIAIAVMEGMDLPIGAGEYYAWYEPLIDVGGIIAFILIVVLVGGICIIGIDLFILSQVILLIIGIVKRQKHKDIDYGHVVLVNSMGLILACLFFVMTRFLM